MPPARSSPLWWCLVTCLLYGLGSGSMAFFNKALVDEKAGFGFRYSQSLLFLQMVFTVALFQGLRAIGVVTFTHPMPTAVHPLVGRTGGFLLRLAPVSTFYCLNALGGMLSLQGLSLPMYSVLKRATPILVAVMEYAWLKRRSTRMVVASLALCMAGFILAGLGDLVFDAKAYALALVSCASQAMYLLQVDKVGKELQVNSHELLYYNSLISLVLLTPVVLLTGELRESLFVYDRWSDPWFLASLFVMLLFGMSLNFFQFLCTQGQPPWGEREGAIRTVRVSAHQLRSGLILSVCVSSPSRSGASQLAADHVHGRCHQGHPDHHRRLLPLRRPADHRAQPARRVSQHGRWCSLCIRQVSGEAAVEAVAAGGGLQADDRDADDDDERRGITAGAAAAAGGHENDSAVSIRTTDCPLRGFKPPAAGRHPNDRQARSSETWELAAVCHQSTAGVRSSARGSCR